MRQMTHADELTALPTGEARLAEDRLGVYATHGAARQRPRSRLVLEAAILLFALLVATIATYYVVGWPGLGWVACFGAFFMLVDQLRRASPQPIRVDVLNDARDVFLATCVAAIGTLWLRVLLADDPAAAAETLSLWGFSTMLLVPGRVASSRLELRSRRARAEAKPTLIIGSGSVGQLIAKRLRDRPELGLRPVGFLDKDPLPPNGSSANLPVLGASWDLDEVTRRYGVRHVILAFSTAPHDVLLRTVHRCHELEIPVSVVPRLFEKVTARLSVDHVGGVPLISIHPAYPRGRKFRLKYALDRVVAGMLLVVLLPLLAVSALAVWISLDRTILYRQRRIGLDGQEFEILKFRSMKSAPDEERAVMTLRPDTAPGGVGEIERRTKVGKFIRATSIDELPQLVNVLRGEMSLVGPRPERPEFAEIFHQQVHRYGERLRVKSGITGWAQVNGLRGQTSLSERVELDNYYIENWSFWLDVKILVLTVREVFSFSAD